MYWLHQCSSVFSGIATGEVMCQEFTELGVGIRQIRGQQLRCGCGSMHCRHAFITLALDAWVLRATCRKPPPTLTRASPYVTTAPGLASAGMRPKSSPRSSPELPDSLINSPGSAWPRDGQADHRKAPPRKRSPGACIGSPHRVACVRALLAALRRLDLLLLLDHPASSFRLPEEVGRERAQPRGDGIAILRPAQHVFRLLAIVVCA